MKHFLLCVLSFLLLTGCAKKAEPAPELVPTVAAPQKSAAFSLSVSQDYALSLLREALPDRCPLKVARLVLSAKQGITVGGTADLAGLCALCDLSYPSFLPSEAEFSSTAKVAFADGKVRLTPVSITVGGLKIPLEKLPAILYAPLEEKLNAYLASLPVRITGLRVEDGAFLLAG